MTQSDKKIYIICGHYGSGKTNIAINAAINFKKKNPDCNVSLADLDIVNPYFRAADSAKLLEENGIIPLIPELANTNVDIPSIPAMLMKDISDDSKNNITIIDVGGDDGAVALGMYKNIIKKHLYEMIFVINMYRPLISEPENALLCMRDIENLSGLSCSSLLNNSSLGAETTAEDIFNSIEYSEKCSKLCSLPLMGHTYCADIVTDVPAYFENHGYASDDLIPIKNITKKLF